MVKPFEDPWCIPLAPLPIAPLAPWPEDWPERTPKGFFEKLKRIPPLTLLCNGWPYSSVSALVANEMSSNSTKHIGPFCLVLKQSLLYPRCLENMALSSSSDVSIGRLPTYSVLHGGF